MSGWNKMNVYGLLMSAGQAKIVSVKRRKPTCAKLEDKRRKKNRLVIMFR
jgi:hypothetical protein